MFVRGLGGKVHGATSKNRENRGNAKTKIMHTVLCKVKIIGSDKLHNNDIYKMHTH